MFSSTQWKSIFACSTFFFSSCVSSFPDYSLLFDEWFSTIFTIFYGFQRFQVANVPTHFIYKAFSVFNFRFGCEKCTNRLARVNFVHLTVERREQHISIWKSHYSHFTIRVYSSFSSSFSFTHFISTSFTLKAKRKMEWREWDWTNVSYDFLMNFCATKRMVYNSSTTNDERTSNWQTCLSVSSGLICSSKSVFGFESISKWPGRQVSKRVKTSSLPHELDNK